MPKTIAYLYDPAVVEGVLQRYPFVRQNLKNPVKEGQEAINFPQCRKTGREIYRILSNQHAPHLKELLRALDYCISRGWKQPKLLQTRAQGEFDSFVAELFVAESFLRRGLEVRGFDDGKKEKPVFDLLVELAGQSVCVEVYCPRDWDGLEYFQEELRLGILHLDVPFDFRFEISMQLINDRDSDEEPLWFNPWRFSETYEKPADRWAKIWPILSEIESHLTRSPKSEIIVDRQDDNLNILTKVRLFHIEKNEGSTPARKLDDFSVPTITGYAPEGMFERLVGRRILEKIKKGQAQSLPSADFKILVVDISKLGYTSEFTHPYYLQQFGTSVKNLLNPGAVDLDMVVFCFSESGAKSNMAIPVLFRGPSLYAGAFDTLFGGGRSFSALSKEVFIENRRLLSPCS